MRFIKKYSQFEGYIDKDGNMKDMNWEEPKKPSVDKDGIMRDMDSEEKEHFIELADLGLKTKRYLEDDTYLSLPENYKEIYKKMVVDEKAIFFHQPVLIQDIIKEYPEECKVCIEKDILESNLLPYSFEVIDILPNELQRLIISIIIHNYEKYNMKEIQYNSFDINIQKIIDLNKDKINIIWKKQSY